jgi:hypothetical protein
MTLFIFANNIDTSLASAITSSSTSITLSSSIGLPTSIPSGYVLVITLNDQATRQVYEVLYATAISGSTLTVERAQEGSAALAWNVGDYAYSAPTAGQMTALCQYPLLPHGSAAITSTGTWTAPDNVYFATFKGWGGGGGSGGSNGSASAGSGGGGGGYFECVCAVVPGTGYSITIGPGGAGGTTSGNGSPGSQTNAIVGSVTLIANGGGQGIGATGPGVIADSAGVGGSASGGAVNISGASGGTGFLLPASAVCSGSGGGTFSSLASIFASGAEAVVGGPGFFPGGGASGGINSGAGAAGANGLVLVEW